MKNNRAAELWTRSSAVLSGLGQRPRGERAHTNKKPRREGEALKKSKLCLHAERRSASAGALHVWILKLEARAFQRLHVVDHATVQVHDRGCIHEHFESVEVENLVHHAGAVLELHGVG